MKFLLVVMVFNKFRMKWEYNGNVVVEISLCCFGIVCREEGMESILV